MRGFLKVKLVRKNRLEYELTVGISFKKLQTPFSKYDEATGLLIENDDDGTSLLVEEEHKSNTDMHYPRLVRLLSNEIIIIDKPVFRIGKEQS